MSKKRILNVTSKKKSDLMAPTGVTQLHPTRQRHRLYQLLVVQIIMPACGVPARP